MSEQSNLKVVSPKIVQQGSRSLSSGGGDLHRALTKATILRAINRFHATYLITIDFEEVHQPQVRFSTDRHSHILTRSLNFRADMVIRHNPYRFDKGRYSFPEPEDWDGIEWSQQILFEIETNPRNIFNDRKLKIEYYRMVKEDETHGRFGWAFVLVIPEGKTKGIPKDHPFDEIWEITPEELAFFTKEEP